MGAPTPELVEKRARELATINERKADEFTDTDWEQAREELLGRHATPTADDSVEGMDGMSERDEVPGESGHRAPRAGFDDDEEVLGARLVTGGIEEAAHDQMVEAAKEDQQQEG